MKTVTLSREQFKGFILGITEFVDILEELYF
jgi:hypothetical protein